MEGDIGKDWRGQSEIWKGIEGKDEKRGKDERR